MHHHMIEHIHNIQHIIEHIYNIQFYKSENH